MQIARSLALLAIVALANCGANGVTEATLGEVAVLRVGESAELSGEGLRFGVSSVPEDSRCPEGVVCAWAGAATVSLWLEESPEPKQELLLTSVPYGERSNRAEYAGYEVELVNVAPPNSGRLRQADYRISLVIRAK